MLSLRADRNDLFVDLFASTDDYVTSGAASREILIPVADGRRITNLDGSLRTNNRENLRGSWSDPLTGSRNLRYLMKYLPRELQRLRRAHLPLAILSCDIDHFKRINDGLGYEAGDEVLRAFVARAGGCIDQRIDWMARSGGEEFVLVLPETNLQTACRVAERLHSVLAAQSIPTSAGPLAITVSTGVAALETVEELSVVSATELLLAAGCGQYASKHLGRDRSTVTSVGRGLVLSDAQTGAILGTA